jgi:hypothetical protein
MADLLPRTTSGSRTPPGRDPQPWYRDAAIVLGAATFTLLVIGAAMLITGARRVGIVGNTANPPVAATTGPATGAVLPPAPPAPGPSVPDAIPAAFLGTWAGTVADANGSLSGQDAVTVRPGPLGSANTTAVDGSGSALCRTAWTLLSATPHQLTFRSSPLGATAAGGCPAGPGQQVLTMNPDATITHTSGGLSGVLDVLP